MGFMDFMFGAKKSFDEKATGYADGDYMRDTMKDGIAGVQGRTAQQVGAAQAGATQVNGAMQNQARQGQMGLAGQLQGVMSGQQAGAGELAAQRQAQRQMAAQSAAARMSRGAGGAYAGLGAARNMGEIGAAAAGQAQLGAMQDQQQAQGLYSQLMGQTRGQDLQLAGQNADLMQQRNLQNAGWQQQSALANQDAQMRMYGLNDQAQQGYLQQMGVMNQNQMQQQYMAQDNSHGRQGGFAGTIANAAAQVGMAYATGGGSIAAQAAAKAAK